MSEFVEQKCSECRDERLVRLANAVGFLVCPECDLVVVERPRPVKLEDNLKEYKTDI